MHTIHLGDNLDVLRRHVPDGAAALIYIDPPFNTGRAQSHTRIKTVRSVTGNRVGFQGQRYATVKMGSRAFPDRFDDYQSFLEPRLREASRALAEGLLMRDEKRTREALEAARRASHAARVGDAPPK